MNDRSHNLMFECIELFSGKNLYQTYKRRLLQWRHWRFHNMYLFKMCQTSFPLCSCFFFSILVSLACVRDFISINHPHDCEFKLFCWLGFIVVSEERVSMDIHKTLNEVLPDSPQYQFVWWLLVSDCLLED